MRIVAEGIENESQARRLVAMGCRLGQGYHYSRPMPAETVAAFVGSFARSVPLPMPRPAATAA